MGRSIAAIHAIWLALAGAVFVLCTGPASLAAEAPQAGERRQIVFPSVSRGGIFDPALAETPAGERAWMSYSAVDPSPAWPETNTRTVSTRLAYSDDRGRTWHDYGRINQVTEMVDGPQARSWNHEVSSLVFDPAAQEHARWKLFWHHYAAVGEDRQFQHGWIAYKEAGSPEKLALATEIKLFAAKGYDEVNDRPTGATGSPVAGPPRIRVEDLGAPARNCIALSEPDGMARPAGLYLAVGCYGFRLLPPGVQSRILLLKCAAPCEPTNARGWRVIGTLLDSREARAFEARSFSASDLFSDGEASYLMVSPVRNRPFPNSYDGCLIFRFSNLDDGTLERAGRAPALMREVHGTPGSFNGACTHAPTAAAGLLYSEIKLANPPVFQIFQVRELVK